MPVILGAEEQENIRTVTHPANGLPPLSRASWSNRITTTTRLLSNAFSHTTSQGRLPARLQDPDDYLVWAERQETGLSLAESWDVFEASLEDTESSDVILQKSPETPKTVSTRLSEKLNNSSRSSLLYSE
ncbi:Hypothetical predicted protein [Xyrichtys novacula]|uniref:Uncharacterized protein n=1 Tax=Xyrichtys novacula TaxID=13765 RepID=A0AAV1GML2_XYRNO|nr:Hypothetical predicted protein [Xyrichtys novacula]